jgi:hypothetical protein
MKNTLQTITNYIKHRHSDNACSKAKEELILKVPILRQQKNRFIIKIRSYFRSKLQKDGMKIIQKMQY